VSGNAPSSFVFSGNGSDCFRSFVSGAAIPLIRLYFCILSLLLATALPAVDFLPLSHQASIWQPGADSLDSERSSLCGEWEWRVEGEASGTCTVPSCWTSNPGLIHFQKVFDLPEDGYRHRYRLEFTGISHSCRVLVNGQFLDSHEGASASFSIDLPDRLLNYGGRNLLEIAVDSRLSARQTLPLKTQSWDPRNYGGIYREVFLVKESRLLLELAGWSLKAADARGRYPLDLELQVSNRELVRLGEDSLAESSNCRIVGQLFGPDGNLLGEARQQVELAKLESRTINLPLLLAKELPLWSPADPARCRLLLELSSDVALHQRSSHMLGLRSFSADSRGLLINGLLTPLRGISYSADHPDYGIALPPELISQDLERIRNLGLNTILHLRGAPHPVMMELCDELGLLVISELPVWQIPPRLMRSEAFLQVAANQVGEFTRRDRSHASLLAVSLGSGLDLSDPIVHDYLTFMTDSLRRDTRVMLAAGGFFAESPEENLRIEGLDLLLLEPFGSGLHPPLAGATCLRIESRVGWAVEIGNQAGYEDPYSELAQARNLQQYLQGYRLREGTGQVQGLILHSYADWLGGRPLLGSPPGQNRELCAFGLLSAERAPRSSAKELAAFTSGSAPSTLARGEYKSTHPPAFPLVGFGLLILLLIGYKQNNVFSQNLRRSFVHTHGFFEDIRDNRIYQFGQSLFIWLLASGTLGLLLAAWLHMLRKSPFFDRLLGLILVVNPAKEWLASLAWNPLVGMAQLGLLIMGIFLLTAIGLRVLGLLMGARFSFRQSMTFLCWSASSLLFVIPLAIVLHPLLEGDLTRTPAIVVLLILLAWFVQRVLKALRIAFRGSFWSMFSLVSVLGLALMVLVAIWYQNAHSVVEYLEYYRRIYWGA
jgi:hypothetical protein